MEKEVWKSVSGYEGLYEVSSLGRLRSVSKGRVMSFNLSIAVPYRIVVLTKEKKRHVVYLHKLVADAFLGKKPNGYDIDHINGLTIDNRISNLRYLQVSLNRSRVRFASDILIYNEVTKDIKFVPFHYISQKYRTYRKGYLSFYLRLYGLAYFDETREWFFVMR